MELSVLVARMLAFVYISASLALLGGKTTFTKIVEDFKNSQGLTFFTGFITLVFGMILVTYHNIWAASWIVIITIVGWLMLLKGFMLIVFPQLILKPWCKNSKIWGIIMLVLGLCFGYLGFII